MSRPKRWRGTAPMALGGWLLALGGLAAVAAAQPTPPGGHNDVLLALAVWYPVIGGLFLWWGLRDRRGPR